MGDIKTRFTLEGEQKFKSAMSDAANAIKVLNSEQKLAKAQFQNTGNAEKYAADQARILKEKIQQQQQAVKAAEQALKQLAANGVAQNTRQFQQWQMRLNNAQTSLVNMETELQNLGTTMTTASGKTEQFSDSLDNIGKKVNYDAVINGIGKITDKMEAAARKAVEMASSLISSMKDAASWADDLATTATVYGVDTDTLQRMKYTANILDTSTDAIIKSRQKLVSNMVNGGDEVQQLFTSLGVAVREFSPGKYGAVATGYRDWADVFWDLGAALTNLEQTKGFEEANAAATKLLGRNWEQLKPLFNSDWASEDNYMGRAFDSAREYYEAVMGSWDTVSDENVNKLTKLDDALQKLQANYEVLKTTVLASLAPAFEQVSNALSTLLTEFNKYLKTDEGKQKLQDLSEAVTSLFSGITDIDFGTAMDTAKDAFDKLVIVLTWISNNWETVKLALEGLAAAFALLKISQGVLTFMQLLSSGKYLLGSKKLTDDLNGLNGGNGGTGGVGTGGQQTVATETVTNQNVTNATVSNETVSSQQVGNATATALNATNANVTAMYVGTLIAGNGGIPTTGNNPTGLPSGGGDNTINLPSGSNTGLNGYIPIPVLPSGSGVGLPSGGIGNPALDAAKTPLLESGGDVIVDGGNGVLIDGNDGMVTIDGGSSGVQIDTAGEAVKIPDITIGADTVMFGSDLGLAGGFAISQAMKPIEAEWKRDAYLADMLEKYGLDMYNPDVKKAVEAAVYGFSVDDLDRDDPDYFSKILTMGTAVSMDGTVTLPGDLDEKFAAIAQKYGSNPDGHFSMSQNPTLDEIVETVSNWWDESMELLRIANDAIEDEHAAADEMLEGIGSHEWDEGPDDYGYFDDSWSPSEIMEYYERQGGSVKIPSEPDLGDDPKGDVGKQIRALGSFEIPVTLRVSGLSGLFSGNADTADGFAANGLPYVPFNGYRAVLHKGERVLTAREAASYNSSSNLYVENMNMNGGVDAQALADAMSARNKRVSAGFGW